MSAPPVDPQPHPLRKTALPAKLTGFFLSAYGVVAGITGVARVSMMNRIGSLEEFELMLLRLETAIPVLASLAVAAVAFRYAKLVESAFTPEEPSRPALGRRLQMFWDGFALAKIVTAALAVTGAIVWRN